MKIIVAVPGSSVTMSSGLFIKCHEVPQKIAKPIFVDNDSFLVICGSNEIYEYYISSDNWNKITDIPAQIWTPSEWYSHTFDRSRQIIYIYNERNEKRHLAQYNFKTKEWDTHQLNEPANQIEIGSYAKSMVFDGKLHIIGGSKSNEHLIWNDDAKCFEVFDELK